MNEYEVVGTVNGRPMSGVYRAESKGKAVKRAKADGLDGATVRRQVPARSQQVPAELASAGVVQQQVTVEATKTRGAFRSTLGVIMGLFVGLFVVIPLLFVLLMGSCAAVIGGMGAGAAAMAERDADRERLSMAMTENEQYQLRVFIQQWVQDQEFDSVAEIAGSSLSPIDLRAMPIDPTGRATARLNDDEIETELTKIAERMQLRIESLGGPRLPVSVIMETPDGRRLFGFAYE